MRTYVLFLTYVVVMILISNKYTFQIIKLNIYYNLNTHAKKPAANNCQKFVSRKFHLFINLIKSSVFVFK